MLWARTKQLECNFLSPNTSSVQILESVNTKHGFSASTLSGSVFLIVIGHIYPIYIYIYSNMNYRLMSC